MSDDTCTVGALPTFFEPLLVTNESFHTLRVDVLTSLQSIYALRKDGTINILHEKEPRGHKIYRTHLYSIYTYVYCYTCTYTLPVRLSNNGPKMNIWILAPCIPAIGRVSKCQSRCLHSGASPPLFMCEWRAFFLITKGLELVLLVSHASKLTP